MARHDDASPLSDVLDTVANDGLKELLRDVVRDALQELIEEELTSAIGAAKHERTETRTTQRNGTRDRLVSTPAGDVELKIRSSARAASSRSCSSRAAAWTGRCGR